MNKRFKSTALNISLILFFTVSVLYLVLRNNYEEVMKVLHEVNYIWFIFILFVFFIYQSIIGLILTILTRLCKKDYKFHEGLVNSIIALFFHGITPSASGGQFAQAYVFNKQGVKVSDSVGILWMDFILYQSSMILFVLILLISRFTYFYDHFSNLLILVVAGFIVNSIIIVGLWAVGRFPSCYKWLTTTGLLIGSKLRIVKDKEAAIANLNIQLDCFANETKRLQSHRLTIVMVMVLNVIRLIMLYSIPYFCALAIGIEVSGKMIVDIIALSSYVAMINAFIPIPGASGGTEVTFIVLFSSIFGIINATSCMVLWRFVTYYFSMIIGGLVFVAFKFIKKHQSE